MYYLLCKNTQDDLKSTDKPYCHVVRLLFLCVISSSFSIFFLFSHSNIEKLLTAEQMGVAYV